MKKTSVVLLAGFLLILGAVSSTAQPYDHTYPQKYGWTNFDNFQTKDLPWTIFAESFIGISPTKDCVLSPMDCALYEIVEPILSEGNCFGMSLLSVLLLKEEGHLGFCRPTRQYLEGSDGPQDKMLRRAINIMACHQLGKDCMTWLIELLKGQNASDGKYAYDRVKEYLLKGDNPVLSLIPTAGKGHVIVPYLCEYNQSTMERYIYVYDCNRRGDSTYHKNKENYVKIDMFGKWSFWHDGETLAKGNIWRGGPDPNDGGTIMAIPSSIAKPASRNPLSIGALVSELNLIFLAGGTVAQISDNAGHQYYKNSAEAHPLFSDIETNAQSGMPSIVRLPLFGGTADNPMPEVYIFNGNPGKNLTFEIVGKGKAYKFRMLMDGEMITVESKTGAPGRDRLEVTASGTRQQEISLSSQRESAQFSVELYHRQHGQKPDRFFRVSNLQLAASTPVRLRTSENQDALLIKSEKEVVAYELEMIQTVGSIVSGSKRQVLNTIRNEWQKAAPSKWSELNAAEIDVETIKVRTAEPDKNAVRIK